MRIDGITLENWMAFRGFHCLNQLPAGAIAVVARYDDNPRRSNWAGKTAFLEAVEWCLYGVHRKRYEDDLIHFGTDFTRVVIKLSDGTKVDRRRDRGKSTKLTVTMGKDDYKQKIAQAKLIERVGFDHPDYRATVCFAQGETAAMVERTSGERRKIVAQWLELDPWLRVAARARAHAQAAATDLQTIRQELKIRMEGLEDFDPAACITDIEGSEKELEEAREALQVVEDQLESGAQAEIQRMDMDRLADLNRERGALRDTLKGQGIKAEKLEALRDRHAQDSHWAETARAESDKTQRLLGGDFDGKCPVTCSDCPVPDEVRGAKEALTTKAKAATETLKDASALAHKTHVALRDLEKKDREVARFRESYNAKTAEAKRLGQAIEGRGMIPELSDSEIQELKDRKAQLREAELTAAADLRTAKEELDRGKSLQEWADEAAAGILDLEKKLRAANLAIRATGPGGIPGAIAESSLGALQQRANGILAGTGLSFDFAWDRETKSLVASCQGCGYVYTGASLKACPSCGEDRGQKRADELEILVDDGASVPEDVKAKSGGAKILVGSSIRFSAGMMLRERRGAQCAWAQVDEPFGALDAENRESLARSFAGMLGSVGLEQAFVVSHDGTLLDALPGRIEIVRYADHSTVELVQ